MLNTMQFENAAEQIHRRGWALVDCPTTCRPQEILGQLPAFFDRRLDDGRRWQATRAGEDEADVGYKVSTRTDLNHSGRSKDAKQHLMFSHDMAELLYLQNNIMIYDDWADAALLYATDELHRCGLEICKGVFTALDKLLKPSVSLLSAFNFAHAQYAPTATSATRLMQYFIEGGQSHIERCALTCHWADKGGELFAICPITDEYVIVSPPPGKVLIFPSAKLQIASQGQLKAVRHGSHCSAGTARLAAVTFCQLITDPLVRDQEQAVKAGLETYKLVA